MKAKNIRTYQSMNSRDEMREIKCTEHKSVWNISIDQGSRREGLCDKKIKKHQSVGVQVLSRA